MTYMTYTVYNIAICVTKYCVTKLTTFVIPLSFHYSHDMNENVAIEVISFKLFSFFMPPQLKLKSNKSS